MSFNTVPTSPKETVKSTKELMLLSALGINKEVKPNSVPPKSPSERLLLSALGISVPKFDEKGNEIYESPSSSVNVTPKEGGSKRKTPTSNSKRNRSGSTGSSTSTRGNSYFAGNAFLSSPHPESVPVPDFF